MAGDVAVIMPTQLGEEPSDSSDAKAAGFFTIYKVYRLSP